MIRNTGLHCSCAVLLALAGLLGGMATVTAEQASPELIALIEEAGGAQTYPNADGVWIVYSTDVVFQTDGSFVKTTRQLTRILTEKGKKEYSTAVTPYNRRYNEVTITRARVINQGGEITEVPADAVIDGTMPLVQQMNIYEENFRQVTVSFPDVDVGDAVETIVEIRSKPLVQNHFNDVYLLQVPEPLYDVSVTIDGPAELPLYSVVENGDVEYERSESDGRVLQSWRRRSVPQIEEELGMVSLLDIATHIWVSTFRDWKELSRYGAKLNVGKLKPDQAIIDKVKELTGDLTATNDKIRAIYNYVSTQIRYMGSSMDLGAFLEPHEVSYTFEKGYGICRDKSILMIAMLNLIGVNAEDTIINVSRRTNPKLPSIFFEHAIVGIYLEDGTRIYMDPTLELSAAFGEPYVAGRYLLPITEAGSDLVFWPAADASPSMGRIVADTRIDVNGSISSQVEISGRGFYDFILRTIGKQVAGFQFLMMWQMRLQEILAGASLKTADAGDPVNLLEPYWMKLQYDGSDALTEAGPYRLFSIPLATFALDLPQAGKLQYLAGLQERHYPLFLFTPNGTVQEERIHIPVGFRVKAVPDSFRFEEGPVVLQVDSSIEDDTVSFRSELRFNAIRLSPQEYLSFRRAISRLKTFQKSYIILETVPVEELETTANADLETEHGEEFEMAAVVTAEAERKEAVS